MLTPRSAIASTLMVLSTLLVGCVDLEKTADDETISTGEEAGFTVTVENTSDDAGFPGSETANVTDELPPQVTFAEDPDIPECEITEAGGVQTLECSFFLEDPGDTASVHVSGLTGPEDCGEITNTAEFATLAPREPLSEEQLTALEEGFGLERGALSGPDAEAVLKTALAAEGITVHPDGRITGAPSDDGTANITVLCPTLVVDKSPDAGAADKGEQATFTIVVTNTGPGDAFDVTLDDQLPTGLAFAADNPDCSIDASNRLTCDFGDIPAGDSVTVTVTATVTQDACDRVLDNEATADASNAPAPASDSGQIVTGGTFCLLNDFDPPDVDVDDLIDDRIDDGADVGAVPEPVFGDEQDTGEKSQDEDRPVVGTGDGSQGGPLQPVSPLRFALLGLLSTMVLAIGVTLLRRGIASRA